MSHSFFGYGSLVNRATHDYPSAVHATLNGWRRTWVRTQLREVVFLSIRPAPGHQILGLVADVPDGDWTALDHRERGYTRFDATGHVDAERPRVAAYHVAHENLGDMQNHCMLLSYLDTVVQGFLREFGQGGAEAFFETTDNWDIPVEDDRGAPRYSRAQTITKEERALTERLLAQVQ